VYNLKACIVLPSSRIFQASISYDWTTRWINHGVALLIAYAKKQGVQLDLIDTRRLSGWVDYEAKIAVYDVVCFSVNTIDYSVYLECLSHLKKVNPSATIVAGGVHPTVKLSDFSDDNRVNFIIQKEGEVALAHLLNCIKVGVNSQRVLVGEPVDLDSIPFIDRTLWMNEYPWGLKFSGKQPFVTILTSRSCLQNCFFCFPCSRTMFGNEERRRSVQNVISELVWLHERAGFKSWMIHDDGFLQNIDWVKQFIDYYLHTIEEPKPFIIQSRANYPVQHPEIIKALKNMGLEMAIVGFESGSDKILKFLRKGTTRETNLKAAKILHENGIKIFANILMGLPTETHEDIDLTMSMVREMKPEHLSVATFSPYPGSDLHDYCCRNDLIIDEYASRYIGEHKIKGVDYDYIQKAVDGYNKDQNQLKYWLRHSNFPMASTLRSLYKKTRRRVP